MPREAAVHAETFDVSVPAARLHRPWRAVVAAGEVVIAGVAVWLAFVLWSKATTDITLVLGTGKEVTVTRYHGNLAAAAIGLGALAALLVLDAIRELMLAIRIKRGRRRNPDREQWPPLDDDANPAPDFDDGGR